jgi:microcystin-dependent protein
MPSKKLIMIGSTVLVILILVVVILMFYKKDGYMYPSTTFVPVNSDPTGLASLYSPSSVINPNTNQPIQYSTLIADQSGNLSTAGNVPAGIIAMWAGSVSNIPLNWSLCDGTNGTPDLRSRFIVGASSATSVGTQLLGSAITSSNGLTSFVAGTTGGEEAHALKLPEIPAHVHQIPIRPQGDWPNAGFTGAGRATDLPAPSSSASTNLFTNIVGGDTNTANVDANKIPLTVPHNNMPPFFALAFIMKTA